MKRTMYFLMLLLLSSGASVAQGIYFEYKMSSTEQGQIGDMKTYYQDGNTRSEVSIAIAGMNKTMASLILKDDPNKYYQLNTDKKTYTVSDITHRTDLEDFGQSDYEVTVLGKEKVNGFNSTHVKVKNIKGNSEQELWTSTEVPGFQDFSKIRTKYTGKENFNKALEAKGAAGFPVRIKTVEHGNAMQIDLVKAERKNNAASLFSLTGYTKSEQPGNPAATNDRQEMIQKLQNMTPEERQKYLEQIKQQYENQAK